MIRSDSREDGNFGRRHESRKWLKRMTITMEVRKIDEVGLLVGRCWCSRDSLQFAIGSEYGSRVCRRTWPDVIRNGLRGWVILSNVERFKSTGYALPRGTLLSSDYEFNS